MLCQFSVKNYKSYKDKTVLEMQAENGNEFENSLIISDKDNKRFLPISTIYGPNAGGKSNFLDAFVTLNTNVVAPISIIKLNQKITPNPVISYKFCEEEIPTEFEVFYRIEKNEFRYNLSFYKGKIIYESLFVLTENAKKPTKIFIRDAEQVELGEELKNKVNTNNNLEIPFLSFLSISYDIDIINKAMSFFFNTIMISFSKDINENISLEWAFEEEIKIKVIELFRNMDIDIVDYREEKIGVDSYKIFMKHIVDNKEYELNLLEESKGTQKLFSLLPKLIRALKEGTLTIIDEMDAKLHPKLVEYIIEMYKNKDLNINGAQLIMTSHDLTTMTNEVYRRDEILFASKNIENFSELYSLYEIRDTNGEHIRKDASYNKQYIEGKYGADTYLQRILSWEVK